MIIRFVEEARTELLDAISDYKEARFGLGARFNDEVNRSIHWIAERPELYRMRSKGYYRINLRVFPYYIAYVVRGETLWVLAVAHSARKPHFWISRRNRVV